ncbi:viral IAP-associated factor homolog isoform X2 [Nilaparvata lugens]|uniref:viral IAP-associated factor homolog isoform X1 n=1 Tax=Nilaparvata lugens TaxID=108931 RepID=UPI00193E632F|nr:viral IAP-associated factor homolog isoform X1 [Nilaparvata lugens]XP_039282260.1 viral IAP-associated factor homolog isoform X2 [Nilaparvata lugens]
MQNPNEDTEWNDILRSKGIIPPKEKELTEDDVVNIVESTIKEKQSNGKQLEDCSLDELDELEDEEDERVLLELRERRLAELRAEAAKAKYREVREISAVDYVDEVNKAGQGVWVILHLYKQGIPLCALINQHLNELAQKFPATKFLKSVSTTCIPNYPDRNLPTIFVYFEGELKIQFVGPLEFRGPNLSVDDLEWMLGQAGAIVSQMSEDPRPKPRDALLSALNQNDDW